MSTAQQSKVNGMWLGRENSGHVVEFLIDGVSFEVWKSSPWSPEQMDKATLARLGAVMGRIDETRWMPTASSATTYIAYNDWIDPTVNLRVVWLSQLVHILMESEHKWVNASKVGNWRLDGIVFDIKD